MGEISKAMSLCYNYTTITMNIEEAEEILNATKLHLEWAEDDLKKLQSKETHLKLKLVRRINEYKQDIEHLTNVIEIMRLKASIPVVNY